jgi:hypothetical protein
MEETKLRVRGSEVATTPTCNEKAKVIMHGKGESTGREHRRKPNKEKGLFVRLCMPIHHNHVVNNSNLIVAAHHKKKVQ